MSLEHICQISLEGGIHSFSGKNSLVTVETPLGRIRKPASEIKAGELIAYKDPSSHMSLNDIETLLLTKSESYRADKNVVFFQNESENYVTQLRVMLLEGILGEEASTYQAKIRGEEQDFSPEEYDEFVAQVKEKSGVTVCNQTVKNWLSGETYAPKEWDNFAKLALINPAFAEIHASKQAAEETKQTTGFYFHYKRMIGTILSARALIEGKTGKVKEKNKGNDSIEMDTEPKLQFDYSEPRAALLAEVQDLITNKIRFLKVQEVKQIHQNQQPKKTSPRPATPTIERGIIFGNTQELPAITYNDLLFDYEVLTNILDGTLERIIYANLETHRRQKEVSKPTSITNKEEHNEDTLVAALLTQYGMRRICADHISLNLGRSALNVVKSYYARLISLNQAPSPSKLQQFFGFFEDNFQKLLRDIRTDTFADKYHFGADTFQRMYDSIIQIQEALPKNYFVIAENRDIAETDYKMDERYPTDRKTRQKLHEALKEKKAAYRKYKEQYGIEFEGATTTGVIRNRMIMRSIAHADTITDEMMEAFAKRTMVRLYTVSDAQIVLTRYGFSDSAYLAQHSEPRNKLNSVAGSL